MMTLSPDMRVSVPSDVLINVIDGQAVLLNLKTERYFGLDEVGTEMWRALTSSDSIESACIALLAEYEVAPERLRTDLLDLAQKLIENGLLEVRGG
jgi:hypothetical protein